LGIASVNVTSFFPSSNMSSLSIRGVSRGAAGLVRTTGAVAKGAVKTMGVMTRFAVGAAGSTFVASTTAAKPEEHAQPSLTLRAVVKSAQVASTAARVSATSVGTVAGVAVDVVGRGLASQVPAAVTSTPIVAGAVEVASAVLDTAVQIVDAVADETVETTRASANTAGAVVGHKYGPQAGSLVQQTLTIAVDATEVNRQMLRLKMGHVAPRMAQAAVDQHLQNYHDAADAAAASNATSAPSPQIVSITDGAKAT
jgi:hypothetical protein